MVEKKRKVFPGMSEISSPLQLALWVDLEKNGILHGIS